MMELEDGKLLIAGRSFGFSDKQIEEIVEVWQEVARIISISIEKIMRELRPVIDLMEEFNQYAVDLNISIRKRKEIYKAERRLKSNVKHYGYKQNIKKKMCCIGVYGCYRRY
jgi:hypothetical protein